MKKTLDNAHIFSTTDKDVAGLCLLTLKQISGALKVYDNVTYQRSIPFMTYKIFCDDVTPSQAEYFSGVCRGVYEATKYMKALQA